MWKAELWEMGKVGRWDWTGGLGGAGAATPEKGQSLGKRKAASDVTVDSPRGRQVPKRKGGRRTQKKAVPRSEGGEKRFR